MTEVHEKEIADQIDRELRSTDSLIALVVCLSVTVGLAIASVASLIGAV